MNTFTSTRKIRTDAQIELAYEANEARRKMEKAFDALMKGYADVTITPAQVNELQKIHDRAVKSYDVYFAAIITK